ncbi:hypothetical protein MMC26_005534 [Xylographa opegraphella]|nr:hypothetical protein [Xylographa opegraphella]
MRDIYFAFGPNRAFIFDGPQSYKCSGIPDAVWDAIGDDKIGQIRCLAMNDHAGGEIFLVYEDANGQRWSWINSTMKTESEMLCSELLDEGETKCRVAFGQNGHYVAWSTFDGWQNAIRPGRSRIEVACVGVDDACFVLQTDGKFWYDLRGNYDALDEIMSDLRHGDIEFLALNPFRVGEFFLLLADNTAVFQVPLAYRPKLEAALADHGISCRALTTQQVEHEVPRATRGKRFVKALVGAVAKQAFGGVISGVASALVGAVACVVM